MNCEFCIRGLISEQLVITTDDETGEPSYFLPLSSLLAMLLPIIHERQGHDSGPVFRCDAGFGCAENGEPGIILRPPEPVVPDDMKSMPPMGTS